MPKQFFMAVTLVLALLVVPLRASAPVCGMSMPAAQKMECAACCAAMKSCILPKQNSTNAVTANSPSQADLTAVPFAPVLLHELAATPLSYAAAVIPRTPPTPARHAVLCTFLI